MTLHHPSLETLDYVASEMERLWGIGRLRLLVSDFLRMKFDAQAEKLNAAIEQNNPQFIDIQAEGMKKAWSALDKAAREAGHRPLDPNVWEVLLPTAGVAIALVRTEAEAHALAKDRVAFTVAEIGQWLEKIPEAVDQVKRKHPGVLLSLNKPKAFDWKKGDPIPF
ncbi:MAG: hypothetical protein V1721_01865 [Pseudomonadota bacterium]